VRLFPNKKKIGRAGFSDDLAADRPCLSLAGHALRLLWTTFAAQRLGVNEDLLLVAKFCRAFG